MDAGAHRRRPFVFVGLAVHGHHELLGALASTIALLFRPGVGPYSGAALDRG
jgi:hypothetical protein